ncbi:MAG: hypothetical protein QXX33_02895 [Candidatus Hadarchaeales archaeon]
MRLKGPKCMICGEKIQIMSMDSAYVKFVRPGEAKGIFICWKCAEKEFGEVLQDILTKVAGKG